MRERCNKYRGLHIAHALNRGKKRTNDANELSGMSIYYIRGRGAQKKGEGKGRRQRWLFSNSRQVTKTGKTRGIITRARHHNMFDCFNNICTCRTLIGGRNMTFVPGLIETSAIES